MDSRIIQLVPRIDFSYGTEGTVEPLLRAVVTGELSQLKIIYAPNDHLSLSSISPELISQAVVRLEECNLRSSLTTDQVRAILDKIIGMEDLKLKRLFLGRIKCKNQPEIPADIIMKTAVKLEVTDIYASLNSDVKERVDWYKFVAENPTMNLKILSSNASTNQCLDVPPTVLAAALIRVEEADLIVEDEHSGPDFSADQYIALLDKIASTEEIKLKRLTIWFRNNLSDISPDILAEAIVRLESVVMNRWYSWAELTPGQFLSIFHKIANCENLRLTELDIIYNDLSSVPADVLVKGISRLEIINLCRTELTSSQAQSIFHTIAKCENLKLKELNIESNDLSSVPADILVEAIRRLTRVHLEGTLLTPAQMNDIFTLVAERTSQNLRFIYLWGNDVSYCVPRNLRKRAKDNYSVHIYKDSDNDDDSDYIDDSSDVFVDKWDDINFNSEEDSSLLAIY